MLSGTLIGDDKGFVIETLYTMDDEPTMLVSRYRVMVMNGHPDRERVPVTFNGSYWRGMGVEAGTDNKPPESMDRIAIKRPRGQRTWRNGGWTR